MSIRSKGLVLAMEDEMEIEDQSPEELTDAVSEVVDSVEETESAADEIDELDESIDDAQTDSDTLEKIQDVMEESVESGEGLDETSAEIAEIAIEAICARLGIKKRTMPALESFGSANSRVVATKIAIEGIGSRLSELWKAIVAGLKTMRDWIKAFFAKILNALEGTKDAIAKLDSAVNAFDPAKVKAEKETIDNKSLAKALALDKKADASTATTIFDNHIAYTKGIFDSASTLKQVIDATKGDVFALNVSKLSTANKAYITALGSVSEPMIGGVVLNVVAEEGSAEKEGFFARFKFSDKESSAENLALLDKAGMEAVLKSLKELQTSSEAYKGKIKEFENINDMVINSATAFAKGLEKVGDKGEGDEAAEISKNAEIAKTTFGSLKDAMKVSTTTIPGMNVKALKAGIQYVSLSLKAYK